MPVHHRPLPRRRRQRRECVDGDGVSSPGHRGTAAGSVTASDTRRDGTATKTTDEGVGHIGETRRVYVLFIYLLYVACIRVNVVSYIVRCKCLVRYSISLDSLIDLSCQMTRFISFSGKHTLLFM